MSSISRFNKMASNVPSWVYWLLIILVDLILVFSSGSTYDSGDSILHYLYAKQAFDYPHHLMDHWAKPVFVLLAAPFAWFGWAGMQLFNALCILGATFYTYRLFQSYHIPGFFAVLFSFAAPHFFLIQSSGLTEPLFTVFLIAIVYYLRKDHTMVALLLLSFLPFVRSEGWVVALVVLFYVVVARRVKYVPFVLAGTVIYGIIGLVHYGDALWMFHQNPYSGVEEKYGSGNWLHFIDQLPYLIGFPLYFLVFIGLFDAAKRWMAGQIGKFELIMIYGMAIAYFFAHSAFWAMGIFHSFGLKRVLIVTIPLLAFISWRGLDRLVCAFGFVKPVWVRNAVLLAIIVFPFTGNKAALELPHSVQKEPLQQMVDEVKEFTLSEYGERRIYFGNWYVAMAYGLDIDDPDKARTIDRLNTENPEAGSLVIWDSYFSVSDKEVTSEFIDEQMPDLKLVKTFRCLECKNSYRIEVYLVE